MEYTHTKDFLIEFAGQPETYGWLKDLIIKVIRHNGELPENELSASLDQLKNRGASVLDFPSSTNTGAHQNIRFISLKHKSGVCALAKDQIITFSKDITLLYGINGSGKSSYFKVLNEIVGGSTEISIKNNIYSTGENPIDIELTYREGTTDTPITWNGRNRAINPLTLSSVFDSTSYTSKFLQKRNADESTVLPYGFHLFAALINAVDWMKGKLQTEIGTINNSLPSINVEAVSDDVKRVIENKEYSSTQKEYIQNRFIISSTQLSQIDEYQAEIETLNKTNFDDKIKIIQNDCSLFEALNKHIENCRKELNFFIVEGNSIVNQLLQLRENSNRVKAQIAILEEIGNTDSKEWDSFISQGASFVENTSFNSDICPYCRQKLNTDAQKIIKAYSLYLSDRSIVKTKGLEASKRELISRINNCVTTFQITPQFETLLKSKDGLYNKTISMIDWLCNLKLSIIRSIQGNITQDTQQECNNDISSELSSIITEKNNQLANLNKSKGEKTTKLNKLKTELGPLLEIQSIYSQRNLFEDWFSKIDSTSRLLSCQDELSTRSITLLAKRANQILITDNLKNKFQEELNALGLQKLRVNLVDGGATRGQTFMQLTLSNNNSVSDILSEGEQKGVALALFIAEKRMQLSNNPIILDDPVNSLDHFIIAKLMERLSTLDNQIIIFSHNILLQSSLSNLNTVHVCGVNQNSSCTKNSKHLFIYHVESRGRDEKGVITEMKQDNVTNNLVKAKKMLNTEPFNRSIPSLGALLRHTIELMIDEKVFNNQIPVKFQGRKDTIHWNELKSIDAKPELLEQLQELFNRLSGGGIHSGVEQSENPIGYEELHDIYEKLYHLAQL